VSIERGGGEKEREREREREQDAMLMREKIARRD